MVIAIYFSAFLALVLAGAAIALNNVQKIEGKRSGPLVDLVMHNLTWGVGVGLVAGIAACLIHPFKAPDLGMVLAWALSIFIAAMLILWVGRIIAFGRAGNRVSANLVAAHFVMAAGFVSVAYGVLLAVRA